jgi:DNA-binding NarL/FixJ family response regulator
MNERASVESRPALPALISGDASATNAAPPVRLSRREREVALLIAEGLPNRQIAVRLEIKERTVEDHVSRLLKKLKVASRAQVMLWAIMSGLVGGPDVALSGEVPGVVGPQ